MPAEKICDRLKGMDQQICGVKYEKVSSGTARMQLLA
jgi:hypothetical protein